MSQQSLFEKLQLKDEKNLLIQGIPSAIEKQFSKLSFSKNVTPLLNTKRIDFALIFAINQQQLNNILKEVIPSLNKEAKFWIAYPRPSSKIVTDLNRDDCWSYLVSNLFKAIGQIDIDHIWTAMRFQKKEQIVVRKQNTPSESQSEMEGLNAEFQKITPPKELVKLFSVHKKAAHVFQKLPSTHQKEYVSWINEAKKEGTRKQRVEDTIERLLAGKRVTEI